jgi:flagellar hook-associated protein 2
MATSTVNLASDSSSSTSGSSETGLGTGIDVQQFVTNALANQQAVITNLQTQQTNLGSQASALLNIQTDLNNLQQAETALRDPFGEFNSQIGTSSASGVVTATADGTATTAVHTVVVNALATTSSFYTGALASGTTTFGNGSFTLQVGTNAAATVTVDGTNDTLAGIAAAINQQNLGVTANVVTDASGARLSLVSNTTGAPGDITISNTTGLAFTKAVTGTNSSLTVDGLPVSSTTNNVSGVIAGVTLNLVSPSTGTPVTVSVGPDTTKATDAINAFVSAYNTAIKDINTQFAVLPDGSGGGPLESDGSLREVQASLLSAISNSTTGNNGIVNLESLGVSLGDDGTLSVDSSKLATVLQSNYSDVQSFLQNPTTGYAQNLDSVLSNLTDPTAGALGLDQQSVAQNQKDVTSQISDLQAALDTQRTVLTDQYSQVNTTLQELPILEQQITQQLSGLS